jgi:hypothetical protein
MRTNLTGLITAYGRYGKDSNPRPCTGKICRIHSLADVPNGKRQVFGTHIDLVGEGASMEFVLAEILRASWATAPAMTLFRELARPAQIVYLPGSRHLLKRMAQAKWWGVVEEG